MQFFFTVFLSEDKETYCHLDLSHISLFLSFFPLNAGVKVDVDPDNPDPWPDNYLQFRSLFWHLKLVLKTI